MTDIDQQAADDLDEYWDAVVEGRASTSTVPNTQFAETIHRLYIDVDVPDASTVFTNRLWRRLTVQTRPSLPVSRRVGALVRRRFPSPAFRAHRHTVLAILATLVIAVVSLATAINPWAQGPRAADAQAILSKVRLNSHSLIGSGIRSFSITESMKSWPRASGLGALANYPGTVQSISTWWFVAPDDWRVEGHYVDPPRSPVLLAGGEIASAPFFPFPGAVVSDGHKTWRYDERSRMLTVIAQATESPFVSPVGALPPLGQGISSLSQVLQQARICYRPKLNGTAAVAGRETYVLDLGPSLCLAHSNSAQEVAGRRVIWVDRQTFFVLKSDLYSVASPHTLLASAAATNVTYNTAVPPRTFSFSAPQGTTVVRQSIMPPNPSAHVIRQGQPHPAASTGRAVRLATLRRVLAFPLFVPATVPAGLRPGMPTVRVEDTGKVVLVTIPYHAPDGSVALSAEEGPLGCCLDRDYRKGGVPVTVPGHIEAHFIPNEPQFGGPILWWDRNGTYVSLSGPDLSEDDLRGIAASMSETTTSVKP